ncbi:uncharacterized protein BXZ73DRAFT_103688 [Epithele typhae]|uniref:uncharacterized protein n=1 Tax=Epithele typhae TaxID=378194 RepID=UPI0020075386|nr:uncharacterized protein BXZ73DRAFT_103688 [Epithele typhae]KAH9923955.1 hypothetical protein BXZ73DRAFT_103688 [Epithele typhae]
MRQLPAEKKLQNPGRDGTGLQGTQFYCARSSVAFTQRPGTFTPIIVLAQKRPTNDPTDEEWMRFDLYARYIRRVESIGPGDHDDLVDWGQFFPRYNRDTPILPRLVHLGVLNIYLPFPIISALFPHTLESVCLSGYSGSLGTSGFRYPLRNALATLSATACNIRKIRVAYFGKPIGEQLKPLQKFKSLNKLDIGCSDSIKDLVTLGPIASLRCLSLTGFHFPLDLDYHIFGDRFQSLEYLTIDADATTIGGVARFIQAVSFPHLRRFDVKVEVESSPEHPDLPNFHLHIAKHIFDVFAPMPSTIQHVSCSLFTIEHPQLTTTINIHPCFVKPILHLRNLTSVKIGCETQYTAYTLDDASLAAMAAAWPLLQTLEISPSSEITSENWHPSAVQPTVRGLAVFAERCPSLKTLLIKTLIEVDNLPSTVADMPPPSGHRLKRLVVGLDREQYDDATCLRLALYVDALFPNIQDLPHPLRAGPLTWWEYQSRVSNPFGVEVSNMLFAIHLGRRSAETGRAKHVAAE